jgi:hydrogenase/urease accessory protein HupE
VEVFDSGAKSSELKPRYDLIPLEAQKREALRMAHGAMVHGENNYRQGVTDPVFIRDRINHMIEHAMKYAAGDTSDDHLAAVRCNAGMLCWLDAHKK